MWSRRASLLASVTLVACAGGPQPGPPNKLVFERVSPPQATSRDTFVGAAGDLVVLSSRISRDRGATWTALDPRFGAVTRVSIAGSQVALYAGQLGLVRWDVATNAITPVAGAPGFATERTWRTEPGTGALIAFDAVHDAIAFERAGIWTIGALPSPSPGEVDPYIYDVESNGTTAVAVSAWGVHRSLDHGVTWERVIAAAPGGGRDLLVLADHRFALVGGPTTHVFDASGQPAGSLPGMTFDAGEASACDDGAIVARGQVSRDVGASWQPLLAAAGGGELTPIVERVGCGGDRYWVLARSDAWGYRLLSVAAPGMPAIAAGNWEAATSAWSSNGPPVLRASEGTFLVAGLAWRDGDPAWSLRETPARAWASGDVLIGVAHGTLYTSHDRGVSWVGKPAAGLTGDDADAFARDATGDLLISTFTGTTVDGTDAWHATVLRSHDDGATWTIAYEGTATRVRNGAVLGEVHRFVGVAADGAWIATDAISRDQGASWQPTEVGNDRGLAFLTPRGALVTSVDDRWRVFDHGGADPVRATYAIEIDGAAVPASQLRSVAFDDAGYAYVAGGTPYVQLWRSHDPLD